MAASSSVRFTPPCLETFSEEERESVEIFVFERMHSNGGNLSEQDYQALATNYNISFEEARSVGTYVENLAEEPAPTWHGTGSLLQINSRTYEIGSELGAGKFARVCRGRETETGTIVALKCLYLDSEDKLENKLIVHQQKAELRALKKLRHPNIVRLYACDEVQREESDGTIRPAIMSVLELCENGELFEYIQFNQGSIGEPVCRQIFKQMMSGVAHMHAHGFAHRDLKPGNIMIDRNFNVKIVDFGFANLFHARNARVRMRTNLGTKGYMAPEIIMGRSYDEKVDIFACGIITFVLVAGYPPLVEAKPGDWWFDRLCAKKYRRFWQAHEQDGSSYSMDFKELIIAMLYPNPKGRVQASQAMESPWAQMETSEGDDYVQKMTALQLNWQNQKEDLTRDMNNFENLERKLNAYLEDQPLTLDDLVQEKIKVDLNNVTNAQSLRTIFTELANDNEKINRDTFDDVQIEDAQDLAQQLINAGSSQEIAGLLNMDAIAAQFVFEEICKTALGTDTQGLMDEVHQFASLQNTTLATYDQDFHMLNQSSFRFRCGFDVFAFGVRYFCKTFEEEASQKKPKFKLLGDKIRVVMKKVKTMILPEEDEAEEEMGGLVQPIEAEDEEDDYFITAGSPAVEVAEVQTRMIIKVTVEANCWQDPENPNFIIVRFSDESSSLMAFKYYKECVENILQHSFLHRLALEPPTNAFQEAVMDG